MASVTAPIAAPMDAVTRTDPRAVPARGAANAAIPPVATIATTVATRTIAPRTFGSREFHASAIAVPVARQDGGRAFHTSWRRPFTASVTGWKTAARVPMMAPMREPGGAHQVASFTGWRRRNGIPFSGFLGQNRTFTGVDAY